MFEPLPREPLFPRARENAMKAQRTASTDRAVWDRVDPLLVSLGFAPGRI